MAQPVLTTGIEILLWIAVFKGANTDLIAGFNKENYLAYAMWAAFFSRISTSWLYEYRMTEEIASGSINSIIVRPMSFYEYYFSQLFGYKLITTAVSLCIPLIASFFFDLPINYARVPLAVILCFYYLIFVHTVSFIVSTFAFHFTKTSSITAAKNLLFWILMGDLFPLDLLPEPFKSIFINLPFASGVYKPAAYIIGRIDTEAMNNGFISLTISLIILGIISRLLWKKGIDSYVGTGA